MKIAYVLELDLTSQLGVRNKLIRQINEWKSQGQDVRVFVTSPNSVDFEGLDVVNVINGSRSRVKRYLNRVFCSLRIRSKLKKFSPDVIYYRLNVYYPGLGLILSSFPVVTEVNSLDTVEIKRFGPVVSFFYSLARRVLMSKVDAFVAVSNEIAGSLDCFAKPIQVVSNGINVEDSDSDGFRSSNRAKKFAFVGSPDQVWHGVDRILELASLLPEYEFHIIGPSEASLNQQQANVYWHGYLKGEELRKLYAEMGYAIGTLCWQRIGMKEGSPLKVREYLTHDLPTIVGYLDTDLEADSAILNIKDQSKELSVSMNDVREFLDNWETRSINKVTLGKVSIENKEKLRTDFLFQIAAR